MRIANVIVDVATQALDTAYSYLVPDADGEDGPAAGIPSLFPEESDCVIGSGGSAGGPACAAAASSPCGESITPAGPEGACEREVQVGCAVLVPLGGRRAVGFVVSVEDRPRASLDARMLKALKPILGVLSDPFFDEEAAACAQWMADRYIAPLSSCVRLFTPPGGVPRMVRNNRGYWMVEQPAVAQVDDRWVVPGPAIDTFEPKPNAVKQQAILKAVAAGDLRVAELAAELGAVSSALKTLERQGAVRVERRRRQRFAIEDSCLAKSGPAPFCSSSSGAPDAGAGRPSRAGGAEPLPLTDEQQHALRVIDEARERGCGEVVLVDGVTGSGKTEVYLRAIASALFQGRNAIVLVPEISLTPQTVGRFRGRFGDQVAVMHSRMSQGERFDQ